MHIDYDSITTHDGGDDCTACRAQDVTAFALLPAVRAWEQANQLPAHALTLHGAAGLLGSLLADGADRNDLERVLATLLDDIEAQIAEDLAFGGPPMGSA